MFRISRLKCKHGHSHIIQNLFARQSTAAAKKTIESANESQSIVLPKKIERGSTDLLYTLSKTIGKDPTAAHYKYQDDPYLIPTSLYNRDQFALSQESGKQTAKWVKQQHAELFNVSTCFRLIIANCLPRCQFFEWKISNFFFQAKDAQPPIEAFFPKPVYTDTSEVELKDLEDSVKSLNVCDTILIYRLLTAKDVTVPDDLKQDILELICFYNQKDPIPFDLFEARGVVEASKRSRDAKPEAWEENGFADQLFESFQPKTPAAYNAMIRGLYKFNSRERAEELFNEANEKQIPLDLTTYNSFIRNINKPGVTAEMRWEQINTTLGDIKKQQLKPNVHTLNACLSTIKSGGNIHMIQEFAVQILAEFKVLNVEPSLATYVHLLDLFHGKQSPASNIIYQIVERIEKNPDLIAHSTEDLLFFHKAMVICRFRLKNSASLARRIDNIVAHSDNIKFIGDAQQEQFYYRNFLTTILHNETFKEFIRTYEQLVPETYSLEPSVADDIFSTINGSGAIQYVPKFWTDMVISGISKRSQLNDSLLALMSINQPVDGVQEHEGLTEQFGDIAWAIYQNAMNSQFTEARQDELIPAGRLAYIIILLLRANRHQNARVIVENCLEQKKDNRILGCLTDEALSAFIDSCVVNKEPRVAIQCLAYSVENGIGDAIQYGRKIIESFTLETNEIKRITDLVGQDVLKSTKKSTE